MALIAALFMIVVVASLGAFAIRIGANQDQTATLQLLTYRADAATMSGLEFLSYNALSNVCAAVQPPLIVGSFNVTVRCAGPSDSAVETGTRRVYDLRAIAIHGVYGSPDFVSRTQTRRVSNVPGGTAIW